MSKFENWVDKIPEPKPGSAADFAGGVALLVVGCAALVTAGAALLVITPVWFWISRDDKR